MHSASYRQSSDPHSAPVRRRAIALLLALAVHVLIILMLLMLTPIMAPAPKKDRNPVTFTMLPPHKDTADGGKTRSKKKANDAAAPKSPAPPKPPTAVTPPKEPTAMPFLTLSRDQFAATDIASLPSHSAEKTPPGGGAAGTGTGQDSAPAYGPGEGPNGEQLYEAEWYRRPTNAELSTYLPANAPPSGWGLVACKTVEHYHVENCQALGESPMGSGLARAVRLAAWQFLVLPPRIGGKPVVGSWVRIRIDYNQLPAK